MSIEPVAAKEVEARQAVDLPRKPSKTIGTPGPRWYNRSLIVPQTGPTAEGPPKVALNGVGKKRGAHFAGWLPSIPAGDPAPGDCDPCLELLMTTNIVTPQEIS